MERFVVRRDPATPPVGMAGTRTKCCFQDVLKNMTGDPDLCGYGLGQIGPKAQGNTHWDGGVVCLLPVGAKTARSNEVKLRMEVGWPHPFGRACH